MQFTAIWKELESSMVNKMSQEEKEKYQMILFICEIQRKGREPTYTTITKLWPWITKLIVNR